MTGDEEGESENDRQARLERDGRSNRHLDEETVHEAAHGADPSAAIPSLIWQPPPQQRPPTSPSGAPGGGAGGSDEETGSGFGSCPGTPRWHCPACTYANMPRTPRCVACVATARRYPFEGVGMATSCNYGANG